MRGNKPDQRFEEHGTQRKDRGLLDDHPKRVAAEQIGEVAKPDETRLRLVQRREKDRIERRIDDQSGNDEDQRQAHGEGDDRTMPHHPSQPAP